MIYLVVLAIFVKRNWINKFIGAGVLHGEILAFQNRETVFQVACWFLECTQHVPLKIGEFSS